MSNLGTHADRFTHPELEEFPTIDFSCIQSDSFCDTSVDTFLDGILAHTAKNKLQ